MSCLVCNHENQYEIEQAMMHLSETCTLEAISDLYGIPVECLKQHAIFHTPMDLSDEETDSIARRLKMSEANAISEVIKEYMITLKNVGRRINKNACSDDAEVKFERLLSKPVVELYIGLGSEIRQNVKALAEIDQILNGPQNDNMSGIAALAEAINRSKSANDKLG